MILLSNSGELARRYEPYILELQEFFATHDVLCGAPRELGFLAARLTGRDSFPGELASMARSFIFREGGSMPLPDLLTVVALAVGGPSVAESASELQHPLNDLSAFLASVAHSPYEHPLVGVPVDEPETFRTPTTSVTATSHAAAAYTEPGTSPNPFPFHVAPATSSLAPSAFAGSKLEKVTAQREAPPATFPEAPANRRKLWAAVAIGLPLLLLATFLYYQSAPPAATSYPDAQAPSSGTSPATISAPNSTPQTSLAAASAALAKPPSPDSTHVAAPFLPPGARPRTSNSPTPQASSAAAPPAQPSSTGTVAPGTSSLPRTDSSAAGVPAQVASTAPPSTSSSATSASPAPSRTAPSHASPTPPTVISVIAQQGAFGVSSGIMSSHLVSFSPPKYPTMAGFTHAQGQVILQAVVSKTGRVSAVKAITGPRTLRKAAETAVKQWRYRPYVVEGHAADVATIITIDVKDPHP